MRKLRVRSFLARLYSAYRHKAKLRKLEWSISIEQFKEITSQNCAYCGNEPIQKRWLFGNKNRVDGYYVGISSERYNGIDRIDNSKGYILDNCAPCCSLCNAMKKDLTVDEFLSHAASISNFKGAK